MGFWCKHPRTSVIPAVEGSQGAVDGEKHNQGGMECSSSLFGKTPSLHQNSLMLTEGRPKPAAGKGLA